MIQNLKRYFASTHILLRLLFKRLADQMQHPLAREFGRVSVAVFIIGLYLQLSAIVYNVLLNQKLISATPLTLLEAVWNALTQYQAVTTYLIILTSLVCPFLLLVGVYYAYRRKDGGYSFKVLFSIILFITAWLLISDSILQSFIKGSLTLGSPLDYVQFWLYAGVEPHIIKHLIMSACIGILPLLLLILVTSKKKIPNIYGNAHFATQQEARKAGLLAERGLLLGKAFNHYLCMAGYEHVILYAPTGTFKTTSLTIPNLLFWEDSCIANDIKLTLFAHTSKYRQSIGHKVFLWNPGSREGITHCYNCLDIISDNPYTRIDEIQKIAAILIPDAPKGEPIWQVQSRYLFVALVLYALDTPGVPKTLGEVTRLVKRTPNFSQWIIQQLEQRDDLDNICRYNFLKFVELHEKTRLSILASFQSYFELFDSPLIDAATSRSDFDIRQLRKEKMTIYVGVTNDNLVRLAPLLTIFYQQVADVMTHKVPDADEPYGILFLMDEFSALRRMESFHKNIGLYREYQLKMVLIIQELAQLYDTYGRDGAKVFINSKVRIAFTQNDEETSQLVSAALGDTTIEVKTRSRHLHSGGVGNTHGSESIQYIKRPLMLTQEIKRLKNTKALILVEGHEAVYANKIRWFKEARFKERMQGAVEIPSILPEVEVQQKVLKAQMKTRTVLVPAKELQQTAAIDLNQEELDQVT